MEKQDFPSQKHFREKPAKLKKEKETVPELWRVEETFIAREGETDKSAKEAKEGVVSKETRSLSGEKFRLPGVERPNREIGYDTESLKATGQEFC